jgi:hypothetical protein
MGIRVKGYGRSARLVLGSLAIAACAALPLSGCSDSGFPSLRMPPPREDTTMTPDQVQKATDALVTERDRLQANNPPTNAAGNTQQANTASAGQPTLTPVVATGSTPTAGAASKP